MVIGAHTVFSCATNFLNGRKCVFCGSFKTVKTVRSYVKCMLCGKQKSLSKLCREIAILQGFYQQKPAYRLASDLGLDARTHYPGVSATTDGALSYGRTGRRQALG